jgi:hypothetical protein
VQHPSSYHDYRGDPAGQRSLAAFAELWARNIEAQGWHTRAVAVAVEPAPTPAVDAAA